MRIMWSGIVLGAALCGWTTAMHGCGAAEEPEVIAPEVIAPQVDPRFATADALLEYFNTLITSDLVNFRSMADLYYAETIRQQPWHKAIHALVPAHELQQEIWNRFERSSETESSPWSIERPAEMVEREEHRAKARYRDPRNRPVDVYFVKIESRWWVSCYTLEYDADLKETAARYGITRLERDARIAGSMAHAVLKRLRAGEFASADEAYEAFGGREAFR